MLQFCNFGEIGLPFHYHYSQIHLVGGTVKVSSLSQIKLFKILLRVIYINFLKPYTCVQIIFIRKEY